MLFVRCRNAQSAVISHFHNFSRVNEIFAKKTLDALRSELKKNPEQVNKVLLVYDNYGTCGLYSDNSFKTVGYD